MPTDFNHFKDELDLLAQAHFDPEQRFRLDAIKIGLITTTEQLKAIASFVEKIQLPTVLDPVIKATAGDVQLIQSPLQEFIDSLITTLAPKLTLITPNQSEASILAQHINPSITVDASTLSKQLKTNLLLKSLPTEDRVVARDLLILNESREEILIDAPRVEGADLHGSGCRHSTNIACYLSEHSLHQSVKRAKEIQTELYHRTLQK